MEIRKIAQMVLDADAILVGAGAGMGVDSGLPDFRGKQGFWRAYPPLANLGLEFEDMANPRWFMEDPTLAWGFYGHRYQLYKSTKPHKGYEILRSWTQNLKIPSFIFTSNVDGHFSTSGWTDQILECHGSLMFLQCLEACGQIPWLTQRSVTEEIEVCMETLRCKSKLPNCPDCHSLARPNILMFSDYCWDPLRISQQEKELENWLSIHGNPKLLVIEIGAGLNIPKVRTFCEKTKMFYDCGMIRINPRDFLTPSGVEALPFGALESLELLDSEISKFLS